MTITSEVTREPSQDGDAAETEFTYSFRILDENDIDVYLLNDDGTETLQTITTHYTVSGVGDANGGTVTFVTAPAADEAVHIIRARPIVNNNDLDNDTAEAFFDEIYVILLRLLDNLNRTVKTKITTGTELIVPDFSANKVLRFDATDTGLLVAGDTPTTYTQASEPSSGVEGDLWIDTDSTDGDLYRYTSGTWTDTTLNLRGPQGVQGPAGAGSGDMLSANDLSDVADAPTARTNLGLEIGTDVLAEQTIGIANDNLVEVDGAPNSGETAVFTANGLAGQTEAEFKTANNLEIGTDVEAFDPDILRADTSDQLTVGFTAAEYDAGTQLSGTYTPDPANGNIQEAVNGGAHTLAPPSDTCTMIIQYTNDGSAGAITISGFTIATGDSFTTTNGHDFFAYITKIGTFSQIHITALQ